MNNEMIKKLVNDVKNLTEKIWLEPEKQEQEIKTLLEKNYFIEYEDVYFLGEGVNTSVYIVFAEYKILIIVPCQENCNNILIDKFKIEPLCVDKHAMIVCSKDLYYHLVKIPNILLVNLCVIENFPIPRLNLSTGIISAYIRKNQIARTTIVDMQIGYDVNDIIKIYQEKKFDIVGISVSFGQKDIAQRVIEELYNIDIDAKIVVGNVIPALDPKGFINKYNRIIVSFGEGETTFPELIEYYQGKRKLCDVNGIAYMNRVDQDIVMTPRKLVDIDTVPLPSLDTIRDIANLKGAMTLETSRGCNYAKCTFCPRQHKLKTWRFMKSQKVVEQMGSLVYVMEKFKMKKHIYLADEEFVGEMVGGDEADRVIEICNGILQKNYNLSFDTSARADSVCNNRKSKEWNLKRIYMWYLCKEAGLDRLFLGIESGCQNQLRRFGKGTTIQQNILALRILTALGIKIRIGFIMFDPLMKDISELKENLDFLARTDAIMNPLNIKNYTYEELYDLLQDEEFVRKNSSGKPIYSVVSYMLASLEVLIGSLYADMLIKEEQKNGSKYILDYDTPDLNMGRYHTAYVDKEIGLLSLYCQKWIDSNFGLMYTVKSLYKTAEDEEKVILYKYMSIHREISQYLLEYLIFALDGICNDRLDTFSKKSHIELIRFEGKDAIEKSMNHWQKNMLILVTKIQADLNNKIIKDTYDARLSTSIELWLENYNKWKLINL